MQDILVFNMHSVLRKEAIASQSKMISNVKKGSWQQAEGDDAEKGGYRGMRNVIIQASSCWFFVPLRRTLSCVYLASSNDFS